MGFHMEGQGLHPSPLEEGVTRRNVTLAKPTPFLRLVGSSLLFLHPPPKLTPILILRHLSKNDLFGNQVSSYIFHSFILFFLKWPSSMKIVCIICLHMDEDTCQMPLFGNPSSF